MFELIDFIIVKPIANILFVIYNFVGDFGLAIIIFTVLVKLLMWPLMKSQLRQTQIMKKLQPELTKIKKNCKGNRQMESIQTMELYKRYKVKPMRSILTLIIQIPIFIALFTAIRVMVTPTTQDNLEMRAYTFTHGYGKISEVIDAQQKCLADGGTCNSGNYDFHPKLFNLVNLDAKITDIFQGSPYGWVILAFAVAASVTQYLVMQQQMPGKKKGKKKSFRQIMEEAKEGKQPEQADLNNMMTGSMSKFMPVMLFFIMIPLPGALVFYYLLINIINAFQQKLILSRQDDDLKIESSKVKTKDVKKIQEGQVIKNKKTGTTITRISAKDTKKKRRKK